MQKKTLFSSVCTIFSICFNISALANTQAISSLYFDEGKVKKIYLAPTIPALITFPCNIQNTLKDIGGSIEAAPDKENPKNLVVWTKTSTVSTLTVLCERRVFVFQVMPSNNHQAYIKVLGSFGGPEVVESNKVVISSSESKIQGQYNNSIPVKKVLMSSSNGGTK